MQWRTDILGDDFQACAFEAAGPDGVLRTATLVRHTPLAPAEPPNVRRNPPPGQ